MSMPGVSTGAGSSTGPDHHTYTFERIQELPLGR
ncbi:hypothetical protein QFZ56_006270 [Streptomyces achromogenes]|uniref:Uncharacterized protein n=1 Tax=Streptomyces achromogenes TaxID=67255 RepID=A0ABU0Q9G7_STRAH|nr:hypothetical protein [Streptomyces achromogenes]